MRTYNQLAQNLKAYQMSRGLTLVALSNELDMPLSTLKSVMKGGNTTLETVIHISKKLNCSLDMLIYDSTMPDNLFILHHMQRAGGWFSGLNDEAKEAIVRQILKVWEVMKK